MSLGSILCEDRPTRKSVSLCYLKTGLIFFPICLFLLLSLHIATFQTTFSFLLTGVWAFLSFTTVCYSGWEPISPTRCHIRRVELLGGWSHIGGKYAPFSHGFFILLTDLFAITAAVGFLANLISYTVNLLR